MRFVSLLLLVLTCPHIHAEIENKEQAGTRTTPNTKQPKELAIELIKPYSAKYTATYDAGWFPISVSATRELKKLDNGHWQVSFEVYSSIADFSERSEFALAKHIKPINYQYKTSGFFSKKRRSKTFDWDKESILLSDGEPATYEVPIDILDNISYQEQMRLDLAKGMTKLAYKVAYKERVREYEFEVISEQAFNSTIGKIETIKVAQTNHRNRKEKTHIWFAKDHQFLIVKLFIGDRHGDKNTITLKNAQLGDTVFSLK